MIVLKMRDLMYNYTVERDGDKYVAAVYYHAKPMPNGKLGLLIQKEFDDEGDASQWLINWRMKLRMPEEEKNAKLR